MANIQVNIDVSDEDFKNLCLENINDLPKDKMEELLLKAVEVALIRDKDDPYVDQDSNVLVMRSHSSRFIKYVPTKLMEDIMKGINTKRYLDPIAKEVARYIKDNYKEMVQEYIVKAFTTMLFSEATEYRIKDEIFRSLSSK